MVHAAGSQRRCGKGHPVVRALVCWALATAGMGCAAESLPSRAASDTATAELAGAETRQVAVDPHSCPLRCGNGKLYALDEIAILPADASGVAPGFDLDGVVSTADSAVGCGFADLRNAQGEGGVDNQFAKIAKLLPSQVFDTLPAALATSIAAGGLTVLLEEVGPSGVGQGAAPQALVIRKGLGVPLTGTDGKLLESQSYSLEPAPVLGVADALTWDGTGVRGGPITLLFRMKFVDKYLSFAFRQTRLRYQSDGHGGISGELAGIVTLPELMGLVDLLGGCDQPLHDQLVDIVPVFADSRLQTGGPCDGFSMGFAFHGVPAFLLASVGKR